MTKATKITTSMDQRAKNYTSPTRGGGNARMSHNYKDSEKD